MSKTYYAVCNVNGPISVSIQADSIEDAANQFASIDHQWKIDNASTDAEDDLDIEGDGMTESEFSVALEAAGCEMVRDMDGWELWVKCDGAVKHGGTWFCDDAEYTADGDRVVRGDGSYAVVGDDAESIAALLATGEASDSGFEWIDE